MLFYKIYVFFSISFFIVSGHWAFGRVLCHLVPFAQGISVYVSTLTLTSIAVDRFFVIIYPFRPRMKLSTCITIIIMIWIFSILITLPYCIYMFQKPIDGKYYCEEQWPVDIVGMVSMKSFSYSSVIILSGIMIKHWLKRTETNLFKLNILFCTNINMNRTKNIYPGLFLFMYSLFVIPDFYFCFKKSTHIL